MLSRLTQGSALVARNPGLEFANAFGVLCAEGTRPGVVKYVNAV